MPSSVPIHILLRVLYKDEIASLAPLSFSPIEFYSSAVIAVQSFIRSYP